VIEVQNDASASIADLVAAVDGLLGASTYTFLDTGTIGSDAIKVGLIYKPSVVEPLGDFAILDSSVDPSFIDTLSRPVLAQSFAELATGEVFTVAVNHLKSKGSGCDALGDPDVGDGQGNCNLTRRDAASAEQRWLASDPTGSGDPDVLLIGDFNAYALEDPITLLTGSGYVNLIAEFVDDDAYSYVFEGQSGYLDHALASSDLAAQVTSAVEWHINADEPRFLDYNLEFNPPSAYRPDAFRSSDHDPLLVGLNLGRQSGCGQ
jgi:predicted extracellular nuclease